MEDDNVDNLSPQDIEQAHIAMLFGKQMFDEITSDAGCPVHLIHAHMKIIEFLLQEGKESQIGAISSKNRSFE